MADFADYQDYDALGLAELIRNKEVTAAEVLDATIEQVEALNPKLNAVVHTMFDESHAAVAAGLPDGPFTGAPYAMKDLWIHVKDTPSTSGSRLFADAVSDHDSTITARLRAAGLVIFAKTNTPEFGLNATTEPVLFGPTRNPYDLARSAGGSSGGSAAAVAARILPAAHATDGGGSIRIPATNCGLFGLKPTRARTPYGPDLGEGANGMSCGHAVTRSVRDSAALLDATHGPAPGDPYCAPAPARPFLEEVGADPGQLRIALMTSGAGGERIDPECVRAAEEAAKLCEQLGHAVEEAMPAYDVQAMRRAWRTLVGGNIKNGIDLRGAARGRPAGEDEVERISWLCAEDGARLSGADYAREIQTIHRLGRRFGDFFQTYDILLSPVLADPPQPLGFSDMMGDDLDVYFDRLFDHVAFTAQFNQSGGPAMSVPLHWTDAGLPVGVHFGADHGNEATLFRLAAQLEQAKPWADRRPAL